MSYKIFEYDPMLKPFENDIELRMDRYAQKRAELLGNYKKLTDFANGHRYYGFHRTATGWIYREWAPGAEAMYLTGDFNSWDDRTCPMANLGNGVY